MKVIYKLDNVDLTDYGVHVSASEGLLSRPRPKRPTTLSWQDYNGEVVDLSKRTYEPREIELDCFIKAASQWEFQDKVNAFLSVLDTIGTKRLEVGVDGLSGGENLILNSKVNKSIQGGVAGFFYWLELSEYLIQGETYIYKNDLNGESQDAAFSDGVENYDNNFFIPNNTPFIAPHSSTKAIRQWHASNMEAGTITLVKLEKGSFATEYTPAPADLKPLVFEVYSSEGIDIKKTWNERSMVGTFKLKLTEPEPIKKVIKFTSDGGDNDTLGITVTSSKLLNIYWGDGSHTYDVSGTAQTATHAFEAGTYYIVVTGNIDEITSLTTTTGTIVWNKL